jgi:hypothetical protein
MTDTALAVTLSSQQDQGRRRHRCRCRRDVTAPGVKGDRGAKLMAEIFRCQIAVNSIEHGKTAHRIAENGDPRRIDEIQLRQVAPRRVGIEHLIEASDAATAGDAARAEAVDGKGHVPPGTQPIGDPGEMPGNANAAVQYDNRRERPPLDGLPSSAAKPASGRAR